MRPGIEPWSPGPLANTLLIRRMSQFILRLVVVICMYLPALSTMNEMRHKVQF